MEAPRLAENGPERLQRHVRRRTVVADLEKRIAFKTRQFAKAPDKVVKTGLARATG